MKALEMSIDGSVIGVFVPPEGGHFFAALANIPGTYMRAQIMSGDERESWQWQLPDIQEGQTVSYRMIEAATGSGIPPHIVEPRTPEEVAESRRRGEEVYERAMKERKDGGLS